MKRNGASEKRIVSEMLPVLRPAPIEEAGLFYSQLDETEDAALGTVGHVRMDFGSSGKEFHHSWWPHNGDQFNTGVLCLLRTIFLETTYASCSGSTPASISNFVFLRIFGAFKASPSLSPTLPMKR